MGYSRLVNWQYIHILAATNYLRERIASGAPDARAKEVYEGLLDVLTPSRIEARANATAAQPKVPVSAPPKAPARRKPAKRKASVKRTATVKRAAAVKRSAPAKRKRR